MTIIKSISTLMYTVWHVDKCKITFKLVINHWTNEILYHTVVSSGQHLGLRFRHIHEYFCPQNISTIKHLFMKIA